MVIMQMMREPNMLTMVTMLTIDNDDNVGKESEDVDVTWTMMTTMTRKMRSSWWQAIASCLGIVGDCIATKFDI